MSFIAIYGNPCDGFRYVGPFSSYEEVSRYVESDPHTCDWWVHELDAPAEQDAKEQT